MSRLVKEDAEAQGGLVTLCGQGQGAWRDFAPRRLTSSPRPDPLTALPLCPRKRGVGSSAEGLRASRTAALHEGLREGGQAPRRTPHAQEGVHRQPGSSLGPRGVHALPPATLAALAPPAAAPLTARGPHGPWAARLVRTAAGRPAGRSTGPVHLLFLRPCRPPPREETGLAPDFLHVSALLPRVTSAVKATTSKSSTPGLPARPSPSGTVTRRREEHAFGSLPAAPTH